MDTTNVKENEIDLELEAKLNEAAGKVINLSKQRLVLQQELAYNEHKLLKMWANKTAHDEKNDAYHSIQSFTNSLRNRIASFDESISVAKGELKTLSKNIIWV
jgi:hypothetical protein